MVFKWLEKAQIRRLYEECITAHFIHATDAYGDRRVIARLIST